MNYPLLKKATLLIAVAASCACSGARGRAAKAEAARTAAAAAQEPRIAGSSFVSTAELAPVRFPYDRDELTPETRETLKRNAAVIKANRSWEVLVEGHCDERGTVAYNLALGQKRAKAVRDYYRALGVPPGRVATLSLGEERADCAEATEDCWRRNRRALSKVKADVAGKPRAAKRHE